MFSRQQIPRARSHESPIAKRLPEMARPIRGAQSSATRTDTRERVPRMPQGSDAFSKTLASSSADMQGAFPDRRGLSPQRSKADRRLRRKRRAQENSEERARTRRSTAPPRYGFANRSNSGCHHEA